HADEKRRDAHDEESQDEHGLASDTIAKMSADHASNRSGREAYCVRAEGRESAGHRVVVREEEPSEDESAGSSIKKEVVPFDRGAYEAGDGYAANGGGAIP